MTFNDLLTALRRHNPAFHSFCLALPSVSLSQRKALLTACRVQVDPTAGPSRIFSRLRGTWLSMVPPSPAIRYAIPLTELVRLIPDISSPVWSGFASMLIRNMPYLDYQEVMEELEKTKWKEIGAAVDTYHPQKLRWSSIFSHSRAVRNAAPLIPGTVWDGEIHEKIYTSLCQAKARVSKHTLYPDYSVKTVGRDTAYQIKTMYQGLKIPVNRDSAGFATVDLEIIYHFSGGVELEGLTEMRIAWKYNDLKPRVYYARGASVYYRSRYIQEIFNVFVDALESTHRFLRFAHHSMKVDDHETIFIYDFSSFTSTLHEVRNFVDALADFCRGTTVKVVDTVLGVIERDLGEILQEFNDTCQKDPMFDISKILDVDPQEPVPLVHNCGMLGVPGNISSCTLLHGIFLMCLLRSLYCKVVGDDAIGHGRFGSGMGGVCSVLADIGQIAEEKMESWSKEDEEASLPATTWHYCKRPLCRMENRPLVGVMVDFPSIAIISNTPDGIHTFHAVSDEDRKRKTAGMLMSLARQATPLIQNEGEKAILDLFLRWAAISSGLLKRNSPEARWSPTTKLVFPRHISDYGFAEGMLGASWDDYITLPKPWDEYSFEWDEYQRRGTVAASKAIRLARDLGYCKTENVMESFVVRLNESRFLSFVNGERMVPTLRVSFVDSTPPWLLDLCIPARVQHTQDDTDNYLEIWDHYRDVLEDYDDE